MTNKDTCENCNTQSGRPTPKKIPRPLGRGVGHTSEKMLYKAYKLFFGTLFSNHRLRIINELRQKPMNVSELINKLKLEQTVISHNLRRLKSCGFVNVEKKGKYRLYSLNQDTIAPLMKIIDAHMSKFCVHIVSNNKRKGD